MKFKNAPQEVAARIRRMPPLEPTLRYLAAAGFLTQHYFGRNIGLERRDPFMRFDKREPDGRLWQFPARVTQIGQIIFSLRNEPGFAEICRRMSSNRDLKSTFAELAAAGMFRQHGFAIHARPETYVRTEDFDFVIVRGGLVVNVEVTALRQATFKRSKLVGRLHEKRKQLPKDRPAILMCFYPDEWQHEARILDLADAAMHFFHRTERVNFLFFAREVFEEFPPYGGALSINCFSVRNFEARHYSDALAKALEGPPEMHAAIEAAMAGPKEHPRFPGEFFEWVDWLTGSHEPL
jgi:hypothetical protein